MPTADTTQVADPSDSEKKKKLIEKISNFVQNLSRIPLSDKIFFTLNLQVMIRTGLSLTVALKTLIEQSSNKRFKKIISDIHSEIEKGESFAKALKKYEKIFGKLYVSMIASGEISGNLEDVLEQLHTQMKKDHDLISKVRGAMIYPSIVVIAMIGIGIAMMIFVIPNMTSIFEETGAELPTPTKVLIGLSNFMAANGLVLALGSIIFVVAFVRLIKTQKGKLALHWIFLRSPILAKISKKINLARLSRTLSALLKTNIAIVESVKITAQTVGNVYYKQALRQLGEELKQGVQMNTVMKKFPRLFPPVVTQMVAVGEESGSIDNILIELAKFYEDDIDQTMKNLPAIIEPVLMVVLGVGVGAMAVAIIMPMYSLTQAF